VGPCFSVKLHFNLPIFCFVEHSYQNTQFSLVTDDSVKDKPREWSYNPKGFSCFRLYSMLLIPVRGRGVCSLVNRKTLLELRSELRSDALSVTTIDFSGI